MSSIKSQYLHLECIDELNCISIKEWEARMLSSDNRSRHLVASPPELNSPVLGFATDSFIVPLPSMPDSFEQESTHRLPAQHELFDTSQLPFLEQGQQLAFSTQADMLSALTSMLQGEEGSTAARQPLVIVGEMKKSTASAPLPYKVHKKRRLVVTLVGMILLLAITSGTLFAASPMGRELELNFNPRLFSSNLVANQNPNVNSLVAQATATYYKNTDGYDPNAIGGQTVGNGAGSLNWSPGQCTWWANYRYHQLKNYWVPWSGDADQWVAGAQKAGWDVSQTVIHVPSIIVLMPGTQDANKLYGHVAVVESASGNSAYTSNMNWYANGGGLGIVSYFTFTTGPGVYFIWHS